MNVRHLLPILGSSALSRLLFLSLLRFKCDECQAFIAGTRIHCTVCEDFDLCFGCFHKELYPAG